MTDQPYDIDKLVADAEAAFNAVRSGATGRFGYSWVFIRDHGEAIIALARDYKAALDKLAAAQAKLDAIEGLARYSAMTNMMGGFTRMKEFPDGEWIRATDLQRITNKEKADV